jgi:hypothetical protein
MGARDRVAGEIGIDADTLYRRGKEQAGPCLPRSRVQRLDGAKRPLSRRHGQGARHHPPNHRVLPRGHKPIPVYIKLACIGWETLHLFEMVEAASPAGASRQKHLWLDYRYTASHALFSGASSPVITGFPSCQTTAYWPRRRFFSRVCLTASLSKVDAPATS